MTRRHPLDRLAQLWMTTTSRRVRAAELPWLVDLMAGDEVVGHDWPAREAAATGGSVAAATDAGLLPSFGALAGPGFDPSEVDPRIVDFYERTSAWRLDVWSQWSAVAWPFGRAATAVWSRRLRQLDLPMHPLDVSWGIDSEVVHLLDADGSVRGAAWLRTLRRTGATIYSGLYGTAVLPGERGPAVRVAFPLPQGSLQVFLRPTAHGAGGLRLTSPRGAFGTVGDYLVLRHDDGTVSVRRTALTERFTLWVDADGAPRCDHDIAYAGVDAVRLHYRMHPA